MVTTTNVQRGYPQDPEYKATGLYIINISPNLLTKDLIQILSKYGPITNAAILGGLNFKHLYGYVDFADCGAAKYCMDALMSNGQDMSLLSVGSEKRYSTFLKFKWKKSEEHTDISRIVNKKYTTNTSTTSTTTTTNKAMNRTQSGSNHSSNSNNSSSGSCHGVGKSSTSSSSSSSSTTAVATTTITTTNPSEDKTTTAEEDKLSSSNPTTITTEDSSEGLSNDQVSNPTTTTTTTSAPTTETTTTAVTTMTSDDAAETAITKTSSSTANPETTSTTATTTTTTTTPSTSNYRSNSNRNSYYSGSNKGNSRKASYSSSNGNDRSSSYYQGHQTNTSLKTSKSKSYLNSNAAEYEPQSQYQMNSTSYSKKYNNNSTTARNSYDSSNKWSNDLMMEPSSTTNTKTSSSTKEDTTKAKATKSTVSDNSNNSVLEETYDDIMNEDTSLGSKYWGDIVVEDEIQMKMASSRTTTTTTTTTPSGHTGGGNGNTNTNNSGGYHYGGNGGSMRNTYMSHIAPTHIPNYHVTPNYYSNSINAYTPTLPSGLMGTATGLMPASSHMSYRHGNSANSVNAMTSSVGAGMSVGLAVGGSNSNMMNASLGVSSSSVPSINAVSYIPQQHHHTSNYNSRSSSTSNPSSSSSSSAAYNPTTTTTSGHHLVKGSNNNNNNNNNTLGLSNNGLSSSSHLNNSSSTSLTSSSTSPSSTAAMNAGANSLAAAVDVSAFPEYQWTKINVSRLQDNITSEHIQKLFSQFGVIKNISLKEAKVGIVVFLEFERAEDAENAVRELDDVHPEQKYPEFGLPPTADTICVDFAYHRPAPSRCYRDSVIPVRIQGLSLDTKRGEIKVACVKYGDIARTRLLKCETAHGAKCSAMVEYVYRESANTALQELAGHLTSLGYQGIKVEQWNYTIKGGANTASTLPNNPMSLANPTYGYGANANYIYGNGTSYGSAYCPAYTTMTTSTYGSGAPTPHDILGSGYTTLNNSPIHIAESNTNTSSMPSSPSSTTTLNDDKEKQQQDMSFGRSHHKKEDNTTPPKVTKTNSSSSFSKNKSKNSKSSSSYTKKSKAENTNNHRNTTNKNSSSNLNKKLNNNKPVSSSSSPKSSSSSSDTAEIKDAKEDSLNTMISSSITPSAAISVSE